jgi:hypothetical protein
LIKSLDFKASDRSVEMLSNRQHRMNCDSRSAIGLEPALYQLTGEH